jgi:glucuronokinase
VAQVYQGLVYMNFARDIMERQGCGAYEEMNPSLLPNLYIAYRSDLSECSDVVHNDLRNRYNNGDKDVLTAISYWCRLTDDIRGLLLDGKGSGIGPLMNSNFDMRIKVCKVSDGNKRMVAAARAVGASAKFTGSGGAIVGTYEDDRMFESLVQSLKSMKIEVIKPALAPATGEDGQ